MSGVLLFAHLVGEGSCALGLPNTQDGPARVGKPPEERPRELRSWRRNPRPVLLGGTWRTHLEVGSWAGGHFSSLPGEPQQGWSEVPTLGQAP